jgi:hypothetical protein
MEDHNQSRNQTNSAEEENVFDLSAEMALPDQKKHKIIDLTNDIDHPENKDVSPSPETRPKEEPGDTLVETAPLDETIAIVNETTEAIEDASLSLGTMPEQVVTDIPEAAQPDEPAAVSNETTNTIEDEVDVAFDAVAVHPESTPPDVDDLLFDELSDITQKVDEAVGKAGSGEPTDGDLLAPSESEPFDDDNFLAQAAELDAAMAGDDDDNDMLPPPSAVGEQSPEIKDDIIELVEVVDPAELDNLEAEATEENDIIELTQIVDKDEVEHHEAKDQNGQAEIETAGLSDQPQPHDTSAHGQNIEDELSLSVIDDDSDFTGDINASSDMDDLFDSAELDGLFDDELSEDTAIDASASPLDDTAIEDADGMFDIVDDLNIDESSEEKPHDNIDEIPSLEKTDRLFDIADQIDGSQVTEEIPLEAKGAEPIEPFEEKTEDQKQVIQLANVLRTSKPQDTTTGLDTDRTDESVEDDALFEDKKIEAAVEKIIRTKYADKMEQLIASAVEKAVTQEIENIKRSLSEMDEPPA